MGQGLKIGFEGGPEGKEKFHERRIGSRRAPCPTRHSFVHHPEEQAKFSEADIPTRIKNLMKHMGEEEPHEEEAEHGADKPKE